MPSKRKNRTVYTTRQIMELTEQRRQKEEALRSEAKHKPEPEDKAPDSEPEPVSDIPQAIVPDVKVENVKTPQSTVTIPVPVSVITGALLFILSLVAFLLIVSSRSVEPWVALVTSRINALIVDGSAHVLRMMQGVCFVKGEFLSTVYYKVSLYGDWVAFSSLEMLVIFAALFVFFHKTDWKKKVVFFIVMVPLAIIANIFRVVVAFGVALNCGTAVAGQYFHEILVACVFGCIVLGLVVLEFLLFSE